MRPFIIGAVAMKITRMWRHVVWQEDPGIFIKCCSSIFRVEERERKWLGSLSWHDLKYGNCA
jgi:hypothetical protein